MSLGNQFTLQEINDFIGGDYAQIKWTVKSSSGKPIDTTHMSMKFALINYSDRNGEATFQKEFNHGENAGEFVLDIESNESRDWVGKYIYQLTLSEPNGQSKSRQGIMTINKNIIAG